MRRHHNHDRRPAIRPRRVGEQWMRDQLVCVIDWALDIAAKLAMRDHDDLVAIERVREFIRFYVAGRRAEVPVRDFLATVAILISAIHIEDERTALSMQAPLMTMRQMPAVLPAVLRVGEVVAQGAAPDPDDTDDHEDDEPEADDDDSDPDDEFDDEPDGDDGFDEPDSTPSTPAQHLAAR